MARALTTRQRLLREGMRQFAQKGYRATTVGDIERAAGLQPRRGALYKHFASKEALLEEAIRERVEEVEARIVDLSALDAAELATAGRDVIRGLIESLGQWYLDQLDRQRPLIVLMEQAGPGLDGLATELAERLIDAGHAAAVAALRAVAPDIADPEATVALLLGGLTALRRTAWTFRRPALGVDDPRALAAWVDLVIATAQTPSAATESVRR